MLIRLGKKVFLNLIVKFFSPADVEKNQAGLEPCTVLFKPSINIKTSFIFFLHACSTCAVSVVECMEDR